MWLAEITMTTHIAAALLAASISISAAHFAQDAGPTEVRGEIVNIKGKPIADAQVSYVSAADGKEYHCSTSADGRFRMFGLPVGVYRVQIDDATGKRIYSSQKRVFASDQMSLNIVRIDLSMGPIGPPLEAGKESQGPELNQPQWRRATEITVPSLTNSEIAHLGKNSPAAIEFESLRSDVHAAMARQDWRLAARLLQRLLEIAPGRWELYQNLGIMQRNLEQYRESIATFEKGLQLIVQDEAFHKNRIKYREAVAFMYLGQGESYFALGDMHAAAAQFRQAAEVDTKPALAYIRLCSAEYNGGNDAEAIIACKRAVEADPYEPQFYQMMAGIQSNLGKYADAIQTFQSGVEMAQREVRVANSSIRSNINSRSSAEISGASRYTRQIAEMLLGEGNAYFSLRKYKEAASLFERAAETHPAPSLAYFNLCAALYNLNDLPGASDACNKAIAYDREMADAYFAKGSAEYGMAARHSKFIPSHSAAAALKKYLELAPMGMYSDRARAILQEAGDTN